MLKLKKLTFATLAAILSTGLLFGCAAEDEEDPATGEPTEEQDNTDDGTEDGTEDEAPEDGAEEGTEG